MSETFFVSRDIEEDMPKVKDLVYGNKDWYYCLYIYDSRISKYVKTWDMIPIYPDPVIHDNGFVDIEFDIDPNESRGANGFSTLEIYCGDKLCWTLEVQRKVDGQLLKRVNIKIEFGKKYPFKHTFPPTKDFLKDSLWDPKHAGVSSIIHDNSDKLYEN